MKFIGPSDLREISSFEKIITQATFISIFVLWNTAKSHKKRKRHCQTHKYGQTTKPRINLLLFDKIFLFGFFFILFLLSFDSWPND